MRRVLLYAGCIGLSMMQCDLAFAQVTTDGTFNTNVTSLPGNNFIITEGRAAGANLFHSFNNFSIPTGGSATFNLLGTPNISTIFSRVTGSNVSHINGRIIAPANLFLLNPNGIIFGANAQLLVSGSFVGTSASSIRFADGFEFAATNSTPALLTISAPIGLQFGQNSGAIRVQGNGHSLSSPNSLQNTAPPNPLLYPYLPTSFSLAGLRVAPGRTLALVGGDIEIEGGIVSAPSGRVEIGSVGSGQVGIRSTTQGFALDYTTAPVLKDIQMSQRSLVDVGWLLDQTRSAGSLQVQGNNIRLSDGSVVLSQNRGVLPGGDLTVRSTGLLELLGTNAAETISSGIISETSGLGSNSNVNVTATGLRMQNGGLIQSRTFSPAPGGAINVNAIGFIEMNGLSPQTNVFNSIGATSFFTSLAVSPSAPPVTTGAAGNITVSTRQLSMRDGSTMASLSFGDASGGNLVVNAETTEIFGRAVNTPIENMPTSLLGVSYRRGNSGTISLNTRTLDMREGGTISTTNLGSGNSGTVTINASESIQLSSQFLTDGWLSNISSTLGSGDDNRQLLNPDKIVKGNAGGITINAPSLQIDQAAISVGNYGIGAAGTLTIDVNSVRLVNGAAISATTLSGEGGNIKVQAQTLVLQNRSRILTEAGATDGLPPDMIRVEATGNGGNITIAAPLIVGVGNSDIIANAVQGRGGNIQITTQGVFGLEFRDLLEPEKSPTNDITASSQSSANGTVQITTLGVDPNSGLVQLATDLSDSSQNIAQGCAAVQDSTFIVSGRGGIPINPSQNLSHSSRVWSDLRAVSTVKSISQSPELTQPLVEATNWQRNARTGKVELIAGNRLPSTSIATCAPSLH